jgi:chorismate mutase
MDKINELRKKIDVLDQQLLKVLRDRLLIVAEVGKIKKELGVPPLDQERWNEVLEKRLMMGESLGLQKEFVKNILDTIHEEALKIEAKI